MLSASIVQRVTFFQEIESINTGIRLLGVTMTNFVDHTELPLVEEEKDT